jgi:1-acyl-sn-glycerol-3-phosphate acyltransferase
MLYPRLVLLILWLLLLSALGLLWAPFRWGTLNFNRDFARVFARVALRLCRIRLEVEGLEHLEAHQPCIYVGNHQSGLDMATFGRIFPRRTVVIGKKELLWIPLFGLTFAAGGNLLIDRKRRVRAIAGLAQVVEAIRARGASVFIFPEGTRNRSSEPLLPFKKGAFYMAIHAGVPIVPIVSQPLGPLVSWKERRIRGGRLRLRVLPPISTRGLSEADVDRLVTRTREAMSEALRGLST